MNSAFKILCILCILQVVGCVQKPVEKTPALSEASLQDLAFTPNVLPSTQLPQPSLETAKSNYLKLLAENKKEQVQVESLQRLAEIEAMQAEVALDDNEPQVMQSHLQQSAQYYQIILEKYSQGVEQDKVRYQLARIMDLQGEKTSSLQLLQQLNQLKSENMEQLEAQFRLAENAFSKKNYPDALKLYSKVLAHPNDPEKRLFNNFFQTALFKRGWTYFKRQNYAQALDDFMHLMDELDSFALQRNQVQQNLLSETIRVSALTVSYIEGAKTLSDYFFKHEHRTYESEVYQGLADLYLSQKRIQDSANTYFTFISFNPQHLLAPDFEHKGIAILANSNFLDLELIAKQQFVEHYATGAKYWIETGRVRDEKVSKWLYDNLSDLMSYYHALAQKNKKSEDYLFAAKWYRIFIMSFPEHKTVLDKRWLLAEILNDAGAILQSLDQYFILAYQENSLSLEQQQKAGYRVVLARQYLLQNEKNDQVKYELKNAKKQKNRKINTPPEIVKLRADLINDAIKYVDKFSGFPLVPEVLAQTIELELEIDAIAKAVQFSHQLLSTAHAQPLALKRAREVIANGEFDLGHFAKAEVALNQIISKDSYPADRLNILHERRAKSIYKQAEIAKLNRQPQKAVDHFLRLGEVEPTSKIRAHAEFDASNILLEQQDYSQAIQVLKPFVKRFPNSPLTSNIPAKLIVAYEATEDWRGAAKQYLLLANRESDDKESARSALWQAATSFDKLNTQEDKNQSINLWKRYINQYPTPIDFALEARNNLVTNYGELNIKWKQDFWRRKIIQEVDHHQLQDLRSKTLAANALDSLANDAFEKFKQIKLNQPLAKSLKNKRKHLKLSLQQFSKLIDYKIQSFATEAGFKMGDAYRLLADSIFHSERPKGMSDLEKEEYDTLLEEKVFPFEDEAIVAFESNASLTQQGIWDTWIEKSLQQLNKLLPVRYNKPEVIDDYIKNP